MKGKQEDIVRAPRRLKEVLTAGWIPEMVNLRLGASWKSRKILASKRLFRSPVTGQGRLQYIGE